MSTSMQEESSFQDQALEQIDNHRPKKKTTKKKKLEHLNLIYYVKLKQIMNLNMKYKTYVRNIR